MKMFLRLKTMTCAVIAISLALSLAGCSGSTSNQDVEAVDDMTNHYQIEWYIQSQAQRDLTTVEASINEYLKDKINATLKLNILESSQYEKKMGTMIAAGEKFDLAFTCNWMLSYETYSKDGAWFDLTDHLDTYLKDAMEVFDEDYLNSAYINDKLYALPTMKEIAQQKGWIYRKDIAEKYNLDMSSYKALKI